MANAQSINFGGALQYLTDCLVILCDPVNDGKVRSGQKADKCKSEKHKRFLKLPYLSLNRD